MTPRRRTDGSRPAGEQAGRPFYARVLGLTHLRPSATLCFIFLEGATALAIVLALAELIPWWGVFLLPACIAAMVKINDLVAGAAVRAATRSDGDFFRRPIRPLRPLRTIGRAAVPGGTPAADAAGRVYRSADATPAEPESTPADGTSERPVTSDETAIGVRPYVKAEPGRGAIPMTRQDSAAQPRANTSPVGQPPANASPVELGGRAARTPTVREWGADIVDTPAQRARHSATRRYE